MEVDQKLDVYPQWIAAHACLKIEFTEGDKCHNLMSRLINNDIFNLVYQVCKQLSFFAKMYCMLKKFLLICDICYDFGIQKYPFYPEWTRIGTNVLNLSSENGFSLIMFRLLMIK